ncbi:MAG: cytochrome B6 [Deltaproteobacteria bacterium]|nr:cytochrome B6 [Deltaproteobacteria bacterium]NCP02605.1 cytochrome B6 [Deltaproteobacteria bacterium]
MRDETVPSSPVFFRLIRRNMLLLVVVLLLGAWLFPAPLQPPADLAQPPNPAKAAWFLLWIQELLSYSNRFAYLMLAGVAGFALLPLWRRQPPTTAAIWFERRQWPVILLTLLTLAGLILLTLIASLWRGENWAFIW